MIKWWALTGPNGRIIEGTIAPSKTACWENGFWVLSHKHGESWNTRYWKRWDASMRSAQRLGYKFIRVNIVPAKRPSGDEQR